MLHLRFFTTHADDQLLARYNYEATRMDWINAFIDLTEGRTGLLAVQQSDGMERHLLRVGRVSAIVVYDPQQACFITALPRNCRCRRF
jgi:hypothetical protein